MPDRASFALPGLVCRMRTVKPKEGISRRRSSSDGAAHTRPRLPELRCRRAYAERRCLRAIGWVDHAISCAAKVGRMNDRASPDVRCQRLI
jgi:hypothetical protein